MIVYDIYSDNCFIKRCHYFGLVQKLEYKLKKEGHIVKIAEKEIKDDN